MSLLAKHIANEIELSNPTIKWLKVIGQPSFLNLRWENSMKNVLRGCRTANLKPPRKKFGNYHGAVQFLTLSFSSVCRRDGRKRNICVQKNRSNFIFQFIFSLFPDPWQRKAWKWGKEEGKEGYCKMGPCSFSIGVHILPSQRLDEIFASCWIYMAVFTWQNYDYFISSTLDRVTSYGPKIWAIKGTFFVNVALATTSKFFIHTYSFTY